MLCYNKCRNAYYCKPFANFAHEPTETGFACVARVVGGKSNFVAIVDILGYNIGKATANRFGGCFVEWNLPFLTN